MLVVEVMESPDPPEPGSVNFEQPKVERTKTSEEK